MKWLNRDIRGKYLDDNSGILRERMPRGENFRFIANYVFANPCVGANECRRALLQWRGFKQCDDSRGQYASYFYDRYHYKWYHSKIWNFMKDENNFLYFLIVSPPIFSFLSYTYPLRRCI